MDYVQHPACAAWPEQSEADVANLAADIQEFGQRVPIVIDSETGMILDGWTRYRACKRAGVEPRFVTLDVADPVAFTISMNHHRRHLDKSQLAVVAARLATMPKGRPQKPGGPVENKYANLRSISETADEVGVSQRQVTYAKEVIDAKPELADDIAAGKLSVNAAVKQVRAEAAEADEPKPSEDRHGDPIAEHIRGIFAESDVIGEWVKVLRRIAGEINKAVRAREPWTAYVRREPVVAAISNAASELTLAELYCICPVCGGDGDGCQHCHGRFDPDEKPGSIGLVNKMTYDIVPDGLKRKPKK